MSKEDSFYESNVNRIAVWNEGKSPTGEEPQQLTATYGSFARLLASMTEQEVKDYLKDLIARYKIPEIVQFYDSLPRNASSKVMKSELIK